MGEVDSVKAFVVVLIGAVVAGMIMAAYSDKVEPEIRKAINQ